MSSPSKNASPEIANVKDNVLDREDDTVHSVGVAGEVLEYDMFEPFPVNPSLEAFQAEHNILRLRSIVVGAMLGGIINAANVYLG